MKEKKIDLSTHYACQFKESTGEITLTLSATGCAQLKLWALQNVKKGCNTVIFSSVTGNIVMYVDADGKVDKEAEGSNIETLCPGLLAALNADESE